LVNKPQFPCPRTSTLTSVKPAWAAAKDPVVRQAKPQSDSTAALREAGCGILFHKRAEAFTSKLFTTTATKPVTPRHEFYEWITFYPVPARAAAAPDYFFRNGTSSSALF